MSLDRCLDVAVAGGELSPELAKKVQSEYETLRVKYIKQHGLDADAAARAAGDDIIERVTRDIRARRHATAQQLKIMEKNQARYGTAPWADPDRLARDMQAIRGTQQTIERQLFAGMQDFLEQHHTNVVGSVRHRALLSEVEKELHGEASGNANAAAIGKGVLATYERARGWANSLGQDIGKLEDFGVPHRHNALKIRAAGFEAWFRELWDNRRLDWSRIANPASEKPFAVAKGARPFEADARAYLRDRFATITTGGWDKREASMVFQGHGGLAAHNSQRRVLHFNSAADWSGYNAKFGVSNSFDAVVGHIKAMASDIALMQHLGPSPQLGLEHIIQVQERALALSDIRMQPGEKSNFDARLERARTKLMILTGAANHPEHALIANIVTGTADVLSSSMLSASSMMTVTDWGWSALASKAIGLNATSPFRQIMRSMTGNLSATDARELGFILNTWSDMAAGQARSMGEDVWQPPLTRRLTTSMFRLTLMNFMTDHNRRGLMLAFGSDLAGHAHKAFADLPPVLQNFMRNRDVDEAVWDAIRAHPYTDKVGGKHLNDAWFLTHLRVTGSAMPDDVARDIAWKWGAMLEDHANFTMNMSSLSSQALLQGGKPGSLSATVMRSLRMFKSYSFNMLINQISRVNELQGMGNKALYAAAALTTSVILGAVMQQLYQISLSRDPLPMINGKFWVAALAKGGGLGILADFAYGATARTGGGFAETIAGPLVAPFSDIVRAVQSDNPGRAAAKLARRYTPFTSFQPPIPIPTRGAIARLIWDPLQLWLDPEATADFAASERKLNRNMGTATWWKQGDLAPSRGPNWANALTTGE